METTYLLEPAWGVTDREKRWNKFFDVPEECSYPDCYEFIANLPDVGPIKVRPIRPEDLYLFQAFFDELTPRSIYMRFFTYLKQLPPKMLKQFIQVDYEREIALVALQTKGGLEKIVGDARVIQSHPNGGAEFSILVSDAWQGKGIGACLLRHCFAIARKRNYKRIHGFVLAENRQMLALGRKLNFTIRYVAGTTEYELSKALE